MSVEPAPETPPKETDPGDAPPVFGTWRRAYWILFGTLLTYIALGWALTQVYS
ncbi:MAG: hypothetical protein IV100_28060 [Myxococcales bacterium]|nr:hypothetical protein [Myxococcales bacterium]